MFVLAECVIHIESSSEQYEHNYRYASSNDPLHLPLNFVSGICILNGRHGNREFCPAVFAGKNFVPV